VLGVQVTAVHRAITFTQTHVFREYIAGNTAKRAASTSSFQKDYYKLKNNSLYGKTVENLRKRSVLRLCNGDKKFVTYSSKPTFKRSKVICQDLVAAMLSKDTICLNRPVYIGQAVLDLSKLRMYRLQYGDLATYRTRFGAEINILAGDTDSFFLEVKGADLTTQLLPAMMEDGLLDTSNYDPTAPLFSKAHENQIGLFKDESGGKATFTEWVFLRPKCYSMLTAANESKHRAKGVTRRTPLQHEQYLEVYKSFNPTDAAAAPPKRVCAQQHNIRSENHLLITVAYNKVALSVMDDKRMWLAQNLSLPYGHYKL
jgi:DNA polymerase type B, organellar and viral